MLALTTAGGATAYFRFDSPSAIGFVMGGAIAVLNFWSLQRIVAMTGVVEGADPPQRKSAVFLGLRYFVFPCCAYVIIKVFGANLLAAVIGFSVGVVAVILEILYELIYA